MDARTPGSGTRPAGQPDPDACADGPENDIRARGDSAGHDDLFASHAGVERAHQR